MSAKQALEPVVDALSGVARRILVSTSHRRTKRMLARLSTYRLRDLGFDRDWDGSIYRPEHRY